MCCDVVWTIMLFWINLWEIGSFSSPRRHMSNSAAYVELISSCSSGLLNIKDLRGCSQCRCLRLVVWCRNNTIPNAIWYRCSSRSCWIFWNIIMDLLSFNTLQEHQGPQVGLNQICLGLWVTMVSNNCLLPEGVAKSPWARPKRMALPWSWFVCLVSSLWGLQKTSIKWTCLPCLGLRCWATKSSISKRLISSCNCTLNFCCWVKVYKVSSHSSSSEVGIPGVDLLISAGFMADGSTLDAKVSESRSGHSLRWASWSVVLRSPRDELVDGWWYPIALRRPRSGESSPQGSLDWAAGSCSWPWPLVWHCSWGRSGESSRSLLAPASPERSETAWGDPASMTLRKSSAPIAANVAPGARLPEISSPHGFSQTSQRSGTDPWRRELWTFPARRSGLVPELVSELWQSARPTSWELTSWIDAVWWPLTFDPESCKSDPPCIAHYKVDILCAYKVGFRSPLYIPTMGDKAVFCARTCPWTWKMTLLQRWLSSLYPAGFPQGNDSIYAAMHL